MMKRLILFSSLVITLLSWSSCATAPDPAPDVTQKSTGACQDESPEDCVNTARELLATGDDLPRVHALLEDACGQGDMGGCNGLGMLITVGKGVPADREQGMALMDKACQAGESNACINAANFHMGAFGGEFNPALFFAYAKKACDAQSPEGCYVLGHALGQGIGTEVDHPRAITLLEQSCRDKEGRACRRLSEYYRDGSHVKKDLDHAKELSKQACDYGAQGACSDLVLEKIYETKEATAEQLTVLEQACKSNTFPISINPQTCVDLGEVLMDEAIQPVDLAKALESFLTACEHGHVDGCDASANIFRVAGGGANDLAKTRQLFQRSCELDPSRQGCTNLGLMLLQGIGGAQDAPRALTFFDKSCQASNARGCINMSLLLINQEQGINQDIPRARNALYGPCQQETHGNPVLQEEKDDACNVLRALCDEAQDAESCLWLQTHQLATPRPPL